MTNTISTSIRLRRIYNDCIDSSNCDNKIRHCSSALSFSNFIIPFVVVLLVDFSEINKCIYIYIYIYLF